MTSPGESLIYKTALNFTYDRKDSARRCNQLLQSIFELSLAPTLEKAIASAIPRDVHLQIDKVEVDLGSIDERELTSELPGTLGRALKEALLFEIQSEMRRDSGLYRDILPGIRNPLLSAIGIYLLYGSVPGWIHPTMSLNQLFSEAQTKYPHEFLSLILKLGKKENVMSRLVYNIKPEIINEMVLKTHPLNGHWVSRFRDWLQLSVSGHKRIHSSNNAFANINLIVLRHFLPVANTSFERGQFAEAVLEDLINSGVFSYEEMNRYINDVSSKSAEFRDIHQLALKGLHTSKIKSPKGTGRDIDLELFIRNLNERKVRSGADSIRNLRITTLQIWKDREFKNKFVDSIGFNGLLYLLELLTPNQSQLNAWWFDYLAEKVVQKQGRFGLLAKKNLLINIVPIVVDEIYRNTSSLPEEVALLKRLMHFQWPESKDFLEDEEFSVLLNNQEFLGTGKRSDIIPGPDDLKELNRQNMQQKEFRDDEIGGRELIEEISLAEKLQILEVYLIKGILTTSYFDYRLEDMKDLFKDVGDQSGKLLAGLNHEELNLRSTLDHLKQIAPETFAELAVSFFFQAYAAEMNSLAGLLKSLLRDVSSATGYSGIDQQFGNAVGKTGNNLKNLASILRSDPILFDNFQARILAGGSTHNKEQSNLLDQFKARLETYQEFGLKKQDPQFNIVKSFQIVLFYLDRGFMPWWAAYGKLEDLITDLSSLSEKHFGLVEDHLREIQTDKHGLELIQKSTQFPEIQNVLKQFDSYPVINTSPDPILATPEEAAEVSASVRERFAEPFELEYFLQEAPRNNEILFRGLYLWSDDQILTHWLGASTDISKQIKTYLDLALLFKYEKLRSMRWRKLIYTFSFEFYGAGAKQLNEEFHSGLKVHLEEALGRQVWSGLATSLSHKIRKAGATVPPAIIASFEPMESGTSEFDDSGQRFGESESSDKLELRIQINNAGLILFWPFLNQFFSRLGIVKDGSFVSEADRNRAVFLLQYLVFGSIDFDEHEMVLNKILTQFPLEEPLQHIDNLNDKEIQLADDLLAGMIKNWEKVKSSSSLAIMETFLQRKGYLTLEEGQIRLLIERKGVDVLLDSLPWSLSTIKLPWMLKPLYSQW